MAQQQDTASAARREREGAGRGRRRTVAAMAALAATALLGLAGCGPQSADAAAPETVRGTAAPVGGDAPGADRSEGPAKPGAKSPGGKASSKPSGSSGAAGGSAAGGGAGGSSGAGASGTGGSGEGGDSGAGSGSGPDAACGSAELSASVGTGRSGAGQQNFPLVLTNSSSRACTVNGYPGMAFLNGAGEQVSVDPERTGAAAGPVRLAPGASAWAPLSYTNPGMTGVDTVTPDSVQITPPDEETPLGASWPGAPVTSSGEASVPKIGPLTPGTGG